MPPTASKAFSLPFELLGNPHFYDSVKIRYNSINPRFQTPQNLRGLASPTKKKKRGLEKISDVLKELAKQG
jgi:hypothetical protein